MKDLQNALVAMVAALRFTALGDVVFFLPYVILVLQLYALTARHRGVAQFAFQLVRQPAERFVRRPRS